MTTPEDRDILLETLQILLQPYTPANTPQEADIHYSTTELMHAIEQHLAIPADPEASLFDGKSLVEHMEQLGYKYANTGGLQLEWMMKKR